MEAKEQHEIYENMRKRVRQKKRLYYHFVVFLLGSFFLIILNLFFKVGDQFGEWFKFAVAAWFIVWLLHFINVFITKRFFGKEWERLETEKLIEKHQRKLQKLENKLIKKGIITPEDALPDQEKKSPDL